MKLLQLAFVSFCVLAWISGAGAAVVTVSGRQILVNGVPYTIKGVCYNPVPVGSSARRFDSLSADLALMREAGINTIRVYSPIASAAVLDSLTASGIKVITGFGYNQGGNNDILSGTYLNYINTYKNHEAILLWELGNEYNYHPEWFSGNVANWYAALNSAASAIHGADPNHPASTAHGEMPDATARSSCPNVDVWGMNIYRWDNPGSLFASWQAASAKPMYLSEGGADSYMAAAQNGYTAGENQKMQADAVRNILTRVFQNSAVGSGITLFAFVDEWWKAGNPSVHDAGGAAPNSGGVPYDGAANEEYWGILNIDRTKKLAFNEIKAVYTGVNVEAASRLQPAPEFAVHPNPSAECILITGLPAGRNAIAIYDIAGRCRVMSSQGTEGGLSIAVDGLKPGVYFIRQAVSGKVQTRWFVRR
jgi:exo-beta-1,3-glucanase (GH17 family)